MRYTYLAAICILALGFLQCSSSKKSTVKVEPAKPDWVINRPIDAGYYIGIGIANKTLFPLNYHEEAKRSALNELAQEIEVNVNSNSMLFSLEQNGEFKEDFKSFVKLSSNTDIQNFEQVAVYESSTDYWVFYRLSKAQYQADKQAKINQAIDQSKVFFNQGEELSDAGRIKESLKYYFKSLQPVAPYLNEQLKTSYNNSEVYWGNTILSAIGEQTLAMQLIPIVSKQTIYWGQSIDETEIGFVLNRNGMAVKNIPVLFTYSEGYIRPRIVNTDAVGKAYAQLGKMRSTNADQYILARVDLNAIYDELEGEKDAFVADLVQGMSAPESRITLDVQPPTIYLDVESSKLGKSSGVTELRSALADAFTAKSFKVVSTKQAARLVARVSLTTEIQSVSGNRYTADARGEFSVVESEKKQEVFNQRITGMRGMQLTNDAAVQKAFDNALDAIEKRFVPQFYRSYLK